MPMGLLQKLNYGIMTWISREIESWIRIYRQSFGYEIFKTGQIFGNQRVSRNHWVVQQNICNLCWILVEQKWVCLPCGIWVKRTPRPMGLLFLLRICYVLFKRRHRGIHSLEMNPITCISPKRLKCCQREIIPFQRWVSSTLYVATSWNNNVQNVRYEE